MQSRGSEGLGNSKMIVKRNLFAKWLTYTTTLAFAIYWASNLLLWFPWSYSTWLGITLMLTVAPVFWAFAIFLSLKTFTGKNIWKGAVYCALIFFLLAVVLDYFFFAVIRGAKEELYHPTTFYGYGFVVVLPFIVALVFKKKNVDFKKDITTTAFVKAGFVGLLCLASLIAIIIFKIEI
jgi:hypothetical protein